MSTPRVSKRATPARMAAAAKAEAAALAAASPQYTSTRALRKNSTPAKALSPQLVKPGASHANLRFFRFKNI